MRLNVTNINGYFSGLNALLKRDLWSRELAQFDGFAVSTINRALTPNFYCRFGISVKNKVGLRLTLLFGRRIFGPISIRQVSSHIFPGFFHFFDPAAYIQGILC